MKLISVLFVALVVKSASGRNDDLFNYGMRTTRENGDRSFGQPDWEDVTCSSSRQCTGYPNKYPYGKGFSISGDSQCEWCPATRSESCGGHRQSPINLERDRGVDGHRNEKFCPDWHWMQYKNDTCTFDDMRDQFTIERHALQIHVPQRNNGDIDCEKDGRRRYPRLDYSKGFPDWWWMQRTDIMVPSQHTQEGVQYAAEVTLAHFYEIDHHKNQLGHIALFMQDYDDAESWPYLDKLICAWRKKEEETRADCGEDPAPPYGRCKLWRGQEPTDEWLREAGELVEEATTANPTTSPTTSPTDSPVVKRTSYPSRMPVPKPVAEPRETTTRAPVPTPAYSPYVWKPIVMPTPEPKPTKEPTAKQARAEPSKEPTKEPTAKQARAEPAKEPTKEPTAKQARAEPTKEPEFEQESHGDCSVAPRGIDCSEHQVNYGRMCKSNDPCCESDSRSDTGFCWESYDALGDANIASACYHCCQEEIGEAKCVASAAPEKPNLPKTIQCSAYGYSPKRMCKPDSCCSNPRSSSSYCQSQYAKYGDDTIEQICHYCCRTPQRVGPSTRNLRSEPEEESIPEGARAVDVHGRRFLLREENFEEDEDEHEYFDRIYSAFQRRSLVEGVHEEDYEDIEWYAYEWMLKVGTEYYYRYEGTMLVPPCWETVHWRPMKDPIRVHKRQIDELHRLLAWRLNPDTCEVDTAGVVSNDGNRIQANREIQYYHNLHRKVFCECKDWPSKFPGDREWCNNWRDDTQYDRFYKRPYSFDTNGEWLPNNNNN